ncbi:DUF5723 family protein [Dyadobacter psychrotolerans]|uniref:DUF5723 domain-containing protein n=1 Tax=Dyadobacter psychrotolerans TaxID=2541721 RepID=A0A4R5DAF0_9BACT|nr:DUF5723 family protein [Dyadobacter psychrotolerans]TDE08414.1 hypothetical protein E0F88_32675 [Dyadobacter psychrotolerans]
MSKFLAMAFILLSQFANAQAFSSGGSASDGILNAFENPALLQLGKSKAWSANVMYFEVSAGSNTASLSTANLGRINADFFRRKILGESKVSSGLGLVEVLGPSLSINLTDKLAMGLSTRSRLHANYSEVNGRLISEIGEVVKQVKEYPHVIPKSEPMRTSIAVFNEIGLSAAYQVFKSNMHEISFGTTLNFINGIGHTSIDVSDFQGILNTTNIYSYLTNSKGEVATRSGGKLLDQIRLTNFFRFEKASLGADFGLSYSFRKTAIQAYKFRIGISITDIGSIRYKADSIYSKSYDINISSSERLYFNNNFKNSSFSETARVFDTYPELFTPTKNNNDLYKVPLPTTLRIQADYIFSPNISISGNILTSLRKKGITGSLYNLATVNVIPRWDKADMTFFLPLTIQEYTGLAVGAGLRYKGLYITSKNLISLLFGTKQVDLRCGFLIRSK